ncbi:MAG: hypothetical protein ACR2NO_08230 [Chloroflexota bacterium]
MPRFLIVLRATLLVFCGRGGYSRRWLAALAAALLPVLCQAENYSDMWFNPSESGWGVTIADHETQLFAVWYTYDTDGSPLWFSVSGGTFNANRTAFSGDLYRSTGPSYAGPFDPAAVGRTKVGTASFQFTPGGSANFTWTIGSLTRSRQIQRLPFGSAPANWGIDRTDLWWNPAESGWGLTLAQHGNNVFGAWFTYAPSGRPLFIIMPGVQAQTADSFTGTLYTTTGPAYTAATFDSAQVRVTPVGSATVRFTGDTATFTATVDGVTQVKTISRQPFGGPAPAAPPTMDNRVEESSGAVAFSGPWTRSSSIWGWSGGSAMQSATAGATASITFTGTSVRWIGSRGRGMGIASVSVDGGPPREVSLFARPTDEIHTPIITISGLSAGPHTLTITVAGRPDPQGEGNVVVVDAFDIQPGTTVSHWQDSNPGLQYSGGWTKSSIYQPYSGTGVSNAPELPVTAAETQAAGATVTVPFRGTGISWIGYRGPDAGIATVRVDSGAASEVDLYSPVATYQPLVFTATGLADAVHALTITATGRKNAASRAALVVVDAFDVITPGRRYEEYESSIVYTGSSWTLHNDARVWSEGASATSNEPGATATFSFTGTSVSWIGCQKGSAGGVADVFIDNVFQTRVLLNQSYPTEGYQMTVFRKDGLAPGPHTLKIQVVNNDRY